MNKLETHVNLASPVAPNLICVCSGGSFAGLMALLLHRAAVERVIHLLRCLFVSSLAPLPNQRNCGNCLRGIF